MCASTPDSRSILGMRVDATDYADASNRIMEWSSQAHPRYVCLANVHMVMESHDSPDFRNCVNSADLVASDGTPLVWVMRLRGARKAQHVRGATLTQCVLEQCAGKRVPVGFYGGTEHVLQQLQQHSKNQFPDLQVVYAYSPPFRQLNRNELEKVWTSINASGARILFVALGCPKQEAWMAAARPAVNLVMLGVGAVFEMLAGTKKQAPLWAQRLGLEWLFRLLAEPRRLWQRYLRHNPRFLLYVATECVGLFIRRAAKDRTDGT